MAINMAKQNINNKILKNHIINNDKKVKKVTLIT